MTAVLLALVSAVAYGVSDFVGGILSKRTSPWTVALLGNLTAALAVLAVVPVTDGTATARDLQWAVLAGVGGGIGTIYLYRGLASGRMGVVAPVSGVGAALLPVMVGLVAGERPEPLVWLGILAAVPGIWLVARTPDRGCLDGASVASGARDGVLAGVGFGGLFAALAQIPDTAGFLPLSVNHFGSVATILLVAVALRRPWVPRNRVAVLAPVTGVLGALATGAFLVASQTGLLAVTAVLASLYPAVTVLMAATVLREHIHRSQGAGLVLCGVAVALVAGG